MLVGLSDVIASPSAVLPIVGLVFGSATSAAVGSVAVASSDVQESSDVRADADRAFDSVIAALDVFTARNMVSAAAATINDMVQTRISSTRVIPSSSRFRGKSRIASRFNML